jgi:hypothetical protein
VPAIQIVRPLESIAETQPQLQPTFAEIVSDDFPSISPRRELDDVVFHESNHKPRPDIQYDGSVRIEERTRTFLIAGRQMIFP